MQLNSQNLPLLLRFATHFAMHPHTELRTAEEISTLVHTLLDSVFLSSVSCSTHELGLHHKTLPVGTVWRWTYAYCPHCETVHSTTGYFNDWLLVGGCEFCKLGEETGGLQQVWYEQGGNIVVPTNPCAGPYLLLNQDGCKQLTSFLVSRKANSRRASTTK